MSSLGSVGGCIETSRKLDASNKSRHARVVRYALLLTLLSLPAQASTPAGFILPVEATCISSPYGPRSGAGPRASTFHAGIDLPAPAGAWVRAAAAGEVAAIRRRGAAGLEVEIRHADGWVTRYAHLGSVTPTLAEGRRRVSQGERIGRIGRTGITYGTHLHFEVLERGERVDPAPLFSLPPCRQLPVL